MKVVLLGKAYVGKTSLVERFMHDRFSGDNVPYQNTIGAAFGAKKVDVDGSGTTSRSVVMGVWDTAGSERYESMSRIYYRGAKAAIVCYEITDCTSFDRARFWINELRENEQSCKLYICGTKKDLVDDDSNLRQVDYYSATDLADEFNAVVFETSSKTNENIKELFRRIGHDYLSETAHKHTERTTSSFQIRPIEKERSSCVCFR